MSGNNMQRVWDALAEIRKPMTVAELGELLHMEPPNVAKALRWLVDRNIAFKTGRRNEQCYGVVPGAARPVDGRIARWGKHA